MPALYFKWKYYGVISFIIFLNNKDSCSRECSTRDISDNFPSLTNEDILMFYFLQRFALTLSFSLHLWRLKGDVTIFRTAEESRPPGAVVGMGRCGMLSKGRPWICSFHLQEQAAQIFSIPMDHWHQVGNQPIWCSHPSLLCPLAGPAGLGWAELCPRAGTSSPLSARSDT